MMCLLLAEQRPSRWPFLLTKAIYSQRVTLYPPEPLCTLPHFASALAGAFLTLSPSSLFSLLINVLYFVFPWNDGTFPAPVLISVLLFCFHRALPLTPCCTELLSPGVQRLSYLRTSSLSPTHSDSRPNPPFRHHFIPHIKGKEAGFSRQHPA